MNYNADDVRQAARGKWALIMGALAPQLEPALRKTGKHVACPVHGGKDGFRLFRKDFGETGGGVCNTCGPYHDGFALLMWLHGWTFKETLEHVGGLLGVEPRRHAQRGQPGGKSARKSASRKAAHSEQTPKAQPSDQAPVTTDEADATPEAPHSPSAAPLEERSPEWVMDLQDRLNRQQSANSERTRESVRRTWNECVPCDSDVAGPAKKYLANRSIVLKTASVLDGESVRFHPSLPYYEEVEVEVESQGVKRKDSKHVVKGRYPALVCAIRDPEGQIITLHRTYLTKTGKKASVPEARKMMAVPDDQSVVGGAIRMGTPIDGVLGVAEGLETALSGYRASGIPTWSLVNTTLLEGFEPPQGVHTVIVWADKDKSSAGERSAQVLKARLEERGLRVFVLVPPLPIPARAKGIDWNDVLREQGILGFPSPRMLRASIYGREVANGTV